MTRMHALVISALLGLAAVAGIAAVGRTVALGQGSAKTVSEATIAARSAQLDRAEAALRAARLKRPPALPAVPVSTRARSAPAVQVVLVRQTTVGAVQHEEARDDDRYREHEAEGGGFDD